MIFIALSNIDKKRKFTKVWHETYFPNEVSSRVRAILEYLHLQSSNHVSATETPCPNLLCLYRFHPPELFLSKHIGFFPSLESFLVRGFIFCGKGLSVLSAERQRCLVSSSASRLWLKKYFRYSNVSFRSDGHFPVIHFVNAHPNTRLNRAYLYSRPTSKQDSNISDSQNGSNTFYYTKQGARIIEPHQRSKIQLCF